MFDPPSQVSRVVADVSPPEPDRRDGTRLGQGPQGPLADTQDLGGLPHGQEHGLDRRFASRFKHRVVTPSVRLAFPAPGGTMDTVGKGVSDERNI